jgi:uncharacterized protein
MIKRYEPVRYRLYDGRGGEIIHFNEDSLDITGITPLHQVILNEFQGGRTEDEVLRDHGYVNEVREIIRELIELGLVSENHPKRHIQIVDLRTNIRAFRIVLTEKCNLRCAECFVTKEQSGLRTMSPETLERTIRQSVPYGASHRITYHFFGGEPLLRFDHIQRAVSILEEAVANHEMVRPLYTITTNLTLLDEEMISFFSSHGFKVGVSVDGSEGVNDMLRMYGDGRGTFHDVLVNYRRLVDAGVDSHVLITPHHDHLDDLPAMFKGVLEQFPMQTITVNTPLHFHSLRWTIPGTRYAKLLIRLMHIAREFGVDIDSAASPPLAALAGGIRREGPCSLVGDSIMASVGPDGRLSFCSQKWHPFLSVSDVSGGSGIHTPVRRDDECATCEARHICGGPCPAFQRIAQASLDGNKCDFMRTLLQEVMLNLDLFETPS